LAPKAIVRDQRTEGNFDHVITTHSLAEEKNQPQIAVSRELDRSVADGIEVGLLTGCQDRPYACGLAMALTAKGLRLEVVGSDEVDSPELHTTSNLRFVNLRGRLSQYDPIVTKLSKLAIYYVRLIRYIAHSNSRILHILWNNKFESFDRTFLMLYYKLCGKKISLTAHNVNQAKRDLKDSLVNRLTLRIQYRLSDHIFVHTRRMKTELCQDFGVADKAVTVIRHPINDVFPDTDLSPAEAKKLLGIGNDERTILFLGRLRPYKGIENLLAAFQPLLGGQLNYRLVVAGAPNKGDEGYVDELRRVAHRELSQGQVLLRAEFIPDEEMELYLKAADVLVLPYKDIFQSGVLFLAYAFGLPVVATDVGSFREEIIEGKTGFICRPDDPADLTATLKKYFSSDLYRDLSTRRGEIKEYANRVHSWSAVAELTRNAYSGMLGNELS
jgi:D-inositol-3-phosphate glycosyltransferase